MRSVARALAAAAVVAMVIAGCTTTGGSSDGKGVAGTSGATTSPAPPVAAPSGGVAGAATAGSLVTAPGPSAIGTSRTDWGEILDTLPDTFPVFPRATVADPPPAPASGIWISKAPVDEVATWYRDRLTAAGFASVDLGTALEDGSRVIDVTGNTPGCKAELAIRPVDGSTMITVFYGSGCADGGG